MEKPRLDAKGMLLVPRKIFDQLRDPYNPASYDAILKELGEEPFPTDHNFAFYFRPDHIAIEAFVFPNDP